MKKPGAGHDANGRIPFTLRVGVTGHRTFEDRASLIPAVRKALRQVKEMVPSLSADGLVLIVVSALAEGADRLVAELVLEEPGSRLEAALPLPVADYERDFEDAASRRQFEELLKRASRAWIAPATLHREEAYERAGCYVVDRSDVVVALWDGEPARGRGGTAAIVAYARDRNVPLVWVRTLGEPVVASERTGPRAEVIGSAARQLREYNVGVIGRADFDARVRKQMDDLRPDLPEASRVDPLSVSVENVAAWLVPYFVRADVLAVRLQRVFRGLSTATFGMAAAAVLIVAIQVNFFPSLNWLVALEVIALVSLLAIPILNRRWRLHDRWISYRFLAERLRSVYFLTLAGAVDGTARTAPLAYLSDPSETWIERALAEVVTHRPEIGTGSPEVASLRRYLSHYWIGGQIGYHQKAARRHRARDDALTRATALLFSFTLVAAVLHMAGIGEHGTHRTHLALLLVVASISIPAIGAAVHGISTQRQFRRQADRYQRMAGLLAQLQEEMDNAESVERVRQLAADTERVMREENSDWFGVMRFHDMELIT
jgi:hypothetical protein